MEIIVEQLDRSKKHVVRHKLAKDTITIGRGFNNDIIIDDQYVCAEHMHLYQKDETWWIRDENSVNGVYAEKNESKIQEKKIRFGEVIRLGKSYIRIYNTDHVVTDSLRLGTLEKLISTLSHPVALMLNVLLFAFLSGLDAYLDKTTEVKLEHLILPALGLPLFVSIWPSLVAFISHLRRNEAKLIGQISISFVFFNLMLLSQKLSVFLNFNLSSDWPTELFMETMYISLTFGLFWFNIFIGFHNSRRKNSAIAAGMICVVVGVNLLIDLNKKQDFNAYPEYDNTIAIPLVRIVQPSDTDAFIVKTEVLFEKTNKEAIKQKKDDTQ